MVLWAKIGLITVGALAAALGLASWHASNRWEHDVFQAVTSLLETLRPLANDTVSFESFESLPSPVAQYFRWALTEGHPLLRTARVEHDGEFRLRGEGEEGWRPFTSVQVFATRPPGFVWNANIRMAPLMPVRVRDSYAQEQGAMLGKLLALVPVVNEAGTRELAEGSLMRYLAEAVWVPTALLPESGVEWAPIDEHTALATLTDGANSVSLEFRFAESGEITGIFSPARDYQVGPDEYETYPWEGFFWAYEEHDGLMIPMEGKVQWNLPEGSRGYWRARITQIEFDPLP